MSVNIFAESGESNGKASILKDTIRLIKELITQLDSLKKENAALLSESHYVSSLKLDISLVCVSSLCFFYYNLVFSIFLLSCNALVSELMVFKFNFCYYSYFLIKYLFINR